MMSSVAVGLSFGEDKEEVVLIFEEDEELETYRAWVFSLESLLKKKETDELKRFFGGVDFHFSNTYF